MGAITTMIEIWHVNDISRFSCMTAIKASDKKQENYVFHCVGRNPKANTNPEVPIIAEVRIYKKLEYNRTSC